MTPTTDETETAAGRLRRLRTANRIAPTFLSSLGEAVRSADLHTLADAWLAVNPIDDGEAITAAWMDAVGGDDERGDGDRVWPIGPAAWLSVGLGGGVWHCWVRSWVREGGGGGEESVTLPQLATRGQLRRLLAAMGVSLPQGGAS